MELVTYHADDPVLKTVRTQFSSLDLELHLIQDSYQSLRELHGHKCSTALSEATLSLFAIIKYVNKADKSLVYWYEKGSTMKIALRFVGVDKRTNSIVQKKTNKIKAKTAKTEAQFDWTGKVFMDGLKAVQTLNKQVNQYSISSLGLARLEANEAQNQANTDAKLAAVSLEKAKVEQTIVKTEFDEIPSQISGVEAQRETAQETSGVTGAVACGSAAVAAGFGFASFFFPPMALIALPAAGLAAGNTIASCVYDCQVDDLRAREAGLVSRMGSLRIQIDSLELKIPELDKKRSSYIETREGIQALEVRGEALQKESEMVLDKLLQAQILLSGLQMKVRAIAVALSDCGYAETRREIADSLKEIMTELKSGSTSKAIECDDNLIAKVLGKLRKVESRTATVLMIMGSNG